MVVRQEFRHLADQGTGRGQTGAATAKSVQTSCIGGSARPIAGTTFVSVRRHHREEDSSDNHHHIHDGAHFHDSRARVGHPWSVHRAAWEECGDVSDYPVVPVAL